MKLLGHMVQQHLAWQEERAHLDGTIAMLGAIDSHRSRGVGGFRWRPCRPRCRGESSRGSWCQAHRLRLFPVLTGTPCVLRGVRVAPAWTLSDLKAAIGHTKAERRAGDLFSVQVPVRVCDDLSTNWAKLEFLETKRFEDFLEAFSARHHLSCPRPTSSRTTAES